MTRAGRGRTYRVEVSQLWVDLDPRHGGRMFEVVAVDSTHATVETVRLPSGALVEKEDRGQTRIQLVRFRPSRRCYRLVSRGLR